MNPTKLKPIEIVRIVNTPPLMAVLNDRQLRRHRDRAGFRISEEGGQTVNLFKYAAWLRSELMLRQSETPLTYEEKRNAARARNLSLATAGRDIGVVTSIARAFRWQQYIDQGKFKNIAELAKAVGQDRSLVARTLRLMFLSPKVIHKIVIGDIGNLSLAKLRQSVPKVWEEQEKMLMG